MKIVNNVKSGSKLVQRFFIEGTTDDPTTDVNTAGTAVLLAEMTKVFTPKRATNLIKIYFNGSFGSDASQDSGIRVAIWVDTVLQPKTERGEFAFDLSHYKCSLDTIWEGFHAATPMTIEIRHWVTRNDSIGDGTNRSLTIEEWEI